MDLLFTHEQKKLDKRYDSHSEFRMSLYSDNNNIEFHSNFHFDYNRYGSRKIIEFVHSFNIEINTGDFTVTYKIINDNLTEDKMFRNTFKQKKNDFKLLFDLTENGFVRGEKRKGYWGVKYNRTTSKIIQIIFEKLKDKIKLDSIKKSSIWFLVFEKVTYSGNIIEIKSKHPKLIDNTFIIKFFNQIDEIIDDILL